MQESKLQEKIEENVKITKKQEREKYKYIRETNYITKNRVHVRKIVEKLKEKKPSKYFKNKVYYHHIKNICIIIFFCYLHFHIIHTSSFCII